MNALRWFCSFFLWKKEQSQSQQPGRSCPLSPWERERVRADGAGKTTALIEGPACLRDQLTTPGRTLIPAFSPGEKEQNPQPLRWLIS